MPRRTRAMTGRVWLDDAGVVMLPGGCRVRGRGLRQARSPADFSLLLGRGPVPPWPSRRIRWPDFWVPTEPEDALDALRETLRRSYAGERVEVGCWGGIGRTGTALAALAVLDGLTPADALALVRRDYHRRAVETPWQRRWLSTIH